VSGPHDLGGRSGFGSVRPEADEPVFHAPWEERALGLTLCAGALGHWTLDESRHARESLPADIYFSATYYEIWVRGLEALLVRHGVVSPAELSGEAVPEPAAQPRILTADRVPAALARGGPCERAIDAAPRFRPGDRVRARMIAGAGHTRLPGYVQGRTGVVEADHGGHVFPDANAHGRGEAPQRLYTVVFAAPELWGSVADPAQTVSVDAWESYLDPA
jgi:nitrile hydratase beta subunit